MREHSRLKVFGLADRLALSVYKATQLFPKEEVFGLTSQLRRAAVSVCTNIVEGCARSSHGDYVHFLNIAYASAKELQYEITLSDRLGYLSRDWAKLLIDQSFQTVRALYALVVSLQKMGRVARVGRGAI